MGRKKATEDRALIHQIKTRVNDKKYKELKSLIDKIPNGDMSRLMRDILYNRTIKVYTKDRTLDNLMEELARVRMEIKAIGININQITRLFNTYPERGRKEFYAKTAFAKYQELQPKIDELLAIISKLGKRWLQE